MAPIRLLTVLRVLALGQRMLVCVERAGIDGYVFPVDDAEVAARLDQCVKEPVQPIVFAYHFIESAKLCIRGRTVCCIESAGMQETEVV